MATDITTDTSNLVINGETYNVKKGATVDGTVMSKGKLQLYNSTGGKVKNFIVSGGTMLVRSSVNSADTITLFGGIFNLQKGGSAVNIDLVNGTIDADTVGYGGGYVSTLRISGGTATFK